MKTIRLSLSRAEATGVLQNSLRQISSTAMRCVDPFECYGTIRDGPGKTTFTIGVGPASFTTARGSITDAGPAESVVSYAFKGPFWAFFKRMAIHSHIQRVFRGASGRGPG
jgi:hypothetical protein